MGVGDGRSGVRILEEDFWVKIYGESEKNIFYIFWILKMDSGAFWIFKIWFFWNKKLKIWFWGKKMCWSWWNMWRGFKKMLRLLNHGFRIPKTNFWSTYKCDTFFWSFYDRLYDPYDLNIFLTSESRILNPFWKFWSSYKCYTSFWSFFDPLYDHDPVYLSYSYELYFIPHIS